MTALPQRTGPAIALMLAGVCMLALMDVALKLLVADYASMQVVFLRCAVSTVIFLGWILATGRRQFRTAYPAGHLLRGLIGLAMLFSVGECLRELQLADAYAIFFAAPLLITVLSGPVLGEPAGPLRTAAAVVGFIGVVIVLKPSGEGWISYGGAMGLAAVLFYSMTVLLLRRMGEKDGSVTIAFWFTTLVGLGSAAFALPSWTPVERGDWVLVAVLGISGTIGQVLLTMAFRRASAAILAPFDYTHMIWAVIYGYWIWNFLPGTRTWVGAGIIVASGLFVIYREQRLGRRREATAARPGSAG